MSERVARAPTLGLVTIGQAPRTDLLPDLLPILGETSYVEHGALDALQPADLRTVGPRPGEPPLTSRLRDGSSILIGHEAVEPLLADAVARSEQDGAHVVLVLCTGHLGTMPSTVPVLYAEPLAQAGVRAITGHGTLGIVSPMADQVADAEHRWETALGRPVLVTYANPYTETVRAVGQAARWLAGHGADWIFLDCIGYTEQMRRTAASASDRPVLLARALAARLAVEAVAAAMTTR